MSHHGCDVVGFKAMERHYPDGKLNYHHAHHRNGVMYWCRCMPAIRIGGKKHWIGLNGKGSKASRLDRNSYYPKFMRRLSK